MESVESNNRTPRAVALPAVVPVAFPEPKNNGMSVMVIFFQLDQMFMRNCTKKSANLVAPRLNYYYCLSTGLLVYVDYSLDRPLVQLIKVFKQF